MTAVATIVRLPDALQMTPLSPVHQGAQVRLGQKRLMREAEPANPGHSRHTSDVQKPIASR